MRVSNPTLKFYFSLFSCFSFWPTLLFEVAPLFRFFRRYLVLYLAVTAVVLMLVKEHTVVHPYNLADNRHLVFYAWRLMSRFRFPLVPLYSASFFIMVYALPKVVIKKLLDFVFFRGWSNFEIKSL